VFFAAAMIFSATRYVSDGTSPPSGTATCAMRVCSAFASKSEYTATHSMPISRAVRMMRNAISPRLAMRMRWNTP
jgi:hypothetical protein